MKLIIIESPYSGDIKGNKAYALLCMKDSIQRGEAPFASHLLYTQVLDDTVVNERHLGMEAGFAWGEKADLVAVYVDKGISGGMQLGIAKAEEKGKQIEYRELLSNLSDKNDV